MSPIFTKVHGRAHVTLSALLALQVVSLASQPIPLTNPGFENPALSDGALQTGIPNWTIVGSGDIGVLNPAAGDFPGEAPEGSNIGYVANTAGEAGVSQLPGGLAGQFQANASYSLSVKVGNTTFFAGFPGY